MDLAPAQLWQTCNDPATLLSLLFQGGERCPRASRRQLRLCILACWEERWLDSSKMLSMRQRVLRWAETGLLEDGVTPDPKDPAKDLTSFWAKPCIALPRILREILGNPFAPPAVDPSWLDWHDGAIPALAQFIHEEQDFDRLPILADALEEAGCASEEILSHLRKPGLHRRGCWVVDCLRGAE